MSTPLIECVPNFSEGRNPKTIMAITDAIRAIPGVALLDVDPGWDANRTVMTFAGSPDNVVNAAFNAIKTAAECIDMRQHQGAHPRIGAADVCPLVPINDISLEETVRYALKLAARVGDELHIPVYLYEAAAATKGRENLAVIRAGGYEGLEIKMRDGYWQPDFGGAVFNPRAGATVIGARRLLLAYNVNLNTSSVDLANAIAFDVREKGRIKKVNGEVIRDQYGKPIWVPGMLKAVKALGWYMEQYHCAQVSMNLVNLDVTPLHVAFEACRSSAEKHGVQVTGSELIGMIPLQALLEAGTFALKGQKQPERTDEAALVQAAVRYLGLDALGPFDPEKKILEFRMKAMGEGRQD